MGTAPEWSPHSTRPYHRAYTFLCYIWLPIELMDPHLSLTQSDSLSSGSKPFRWKLWLTLASPVIFIGGFVIFFFHAKSTYLPMVISASSHLHEQLRLGQEQQIYANADSAFQTAQPSDSTLKFLAGVRRKLGTCRYSGPTNWTVNSNASGTFVTVTYDEQCSNGAANETLTWRITNGATLLTGMHVNSSVFITQ